jgi:putative redox protein
MAGMAAATPSSAPSSSKENLVDDERAQLMQAANTCSVGRTLGLSANTRTDDNVSVGRAANYDDDLSELPVPNIDPD